MLGHCCTLPKFKPVTHVIFDLDGTLIDSEKIYASALKQAVESYGKVWRPEALTKIAGSVMATTARIAVEFHELECSIEEFMDNFNNLANQQLHDVDLMPGAEKLVRHFHTHNVPLAIATSSQESSFKMKTEKHRELFDLFGHVVCGGSDPMVRNGKPAPDIFLVCASRFPENPKPEMCLVFEDSANGVLGAVAAGMQVVMTPEPTVPYDIWKNATLRIDTLEYMIPQLFNLPPFPFDDSKDAAAESATDNTQEGGSEANDNERPNEGQVNDTNEEVVAQ